jgi:hypothetical protein
MRSKICQEWRLQEFCFRECMAKFYGEMWWHDFKFKRRLSSHWNWGIWGPGGYGTILRMQFSSQRVTSKLENTDSWRKILVLSLCYCTSDFRNLVVWISPESHNSRKHVFLIFYNVSLKHVSIQQINVKLFLCLTKQYAVKAYGGMDV